MRHLIVKAALLAACASSLAIAACTSKDRPPASGPVPPSAETCRAGDTRPECTWPDGRPK